MIPRNCIVIEDSGNGIEAAKKAEMMAVGITTQFQNKEDLKEADLVINNLSELSIAKLFILLE